MKVIENRIIKVDGYLCDICGQRLLQNGDGELIKEKGVDGDYKYTLHTKCLIEWLDKLLTS